MSKKPGLTLAEHHELGAELKLMHRRLITLSVKLGNAYSAPLSGRVDAVIKKLGARRSELDAVVFAEHPEQETKTLSAVYYPSEATERRRG